MTSLLHSNLGPKTRIHVVCSGRIRRAFLAAVAIYVVLDEGDCVFDGGGFSANMANLRQSLACVHIVVLIQ